MSLGKGLISPGFEVHCRPMTQILSNRFHALFLSFGLASTLLVSGPSALAQPPLAPGEAFRRTQAVLKHFQVPEEEPSTPLLQDLARTQSAYGMSKLLPFLDPKGHWSRFSQVDASTDVLRGFQDRDSKWYVDFDVALLTKGDELNSRSDLVERLQKVALNPPSLPLQGLKVALDPGHMGGEEWDKLTGKYVRDRAGHRLSEGLMALQTALLLEKEFTALGAEVMLTRRGLEPVTPIPYSRLNLREFGRVELRQSALSDWFRSLLLSGAPGPELYRAFENSRDVRRLFSEDARSRYFILRADLDARSNMIQMFNPDVTLIIHYDSMDPANDPNGLNPNGYVRTKAYVAGAFEDEEFASREDRRYFARHLLNPHAFEASVRLSRNVVHSIRSRMKIELDPAGGAMAKQVEGGVFSRNLALTRKLNGHALSYLECLHYNAPKEFAAFRQVKHPLMIEGVNHPYSDRLLQVVHSIRDGVVGFVSSYQGNPQD